MTKRAKIIIGALIALLVLLGVGAGFYANSGVSPDQSSNQIKGEIEKAFQGKSYFKEVKVKTYSGTTEETDPNKAAKSAAISLFFNKMDAATFKEAASILPELKTTAFYSFGDSVDMNNLTSVTGFRNADFRDETVVKSIVSSLKVQESVKSSYWQISRGDAEGNDATKLKTQFVTKSTDPTEIRKTVDLVLTDKMDVLPVAKTDLSTGSFIQFAAVQGKMTNFDKGLELGLKFADATFLDGQKVVFLGLGDDIQISYTAVRKDLDKAKLTEIAKGLNKDQLFKINVVSPEDAAKSQPDNTAPLSPRATPSGSASPAPSQSSTPSPSTTK